MKPSELRSLLLIVLIAASVLVLAGLVLGRVQHWPIGNYILAVGLMLEVASGIGLAVLSWRARHDK